MMTKAQYEKREELKQQLWALFTVRPKGDIFFQVLNYIEHVSKGSPYSPDIVLAELETMVKLLRDNKRDGDE